MGAKAKLVRDFDEFLKLRQPWTELVRDSDVDHAFMRHEWFTCWIRHLGNPRQIMIQTLWSDGQLVGVAPMQIGFQRIKGIPLRLLSFLSSSISPRCNFILHASCDKELFFDNLLGTRGWDLIFTPNLESSQGATQDYMSFLESRRGRRHDSEPGRNSPYQVICGKWDDYYNGLSKNHRKNIRVAFKRLEEAGTHSFELYETFEEAGDALERMVEISGESWKAQSASDLLTNKPIADFYRDFSREGSKDGLWFLHMLKIDGAYAAFDYYLKLGPRLTGIRSDYSMRYKDFMPGHLVKIATIKHICSTGEAWEYDMGGMAAEYKLSYTNEARSHIHIMACSSGSYGKLLMLGKKKFWPLVKKFQKQSAGFAEVPLMAAHTETRED